MVVMVVMEEDILGGGLTGPGVGTTEVIIIIKSNVLNNIWKKK